MFLEQFLRQDQGMLRNLLTVGGWTMLSRVLGFIRDQLLAASLGAGAVQVVY